MTKTLLRNPPDLKKRKFCAFPTGTDLQAQAISDATHQAQAAVGMADRHSPKSQTEADRTKKTVRKERVRLHGIYRLPLFMSGEGKDATDALRKSENWYYAEMEIMALVKRLHITYGIVNDSAIHDEIQSPPQVGERLENSPEVDEGDAYPEVATGAVYIRDAFEDAPEHGDALA
ncbi:MAG TPA: hypothetical protein VNE63_00830 [Candidatus Acidoferrales bacterium]|nr:hypothetical protein [Candidatus Acidoferrales bacterium]